MQRSGLGAGDHARDVFLPDGDVSDDDTPDDDAPDDEAADDGTSELEDDTWRWRTTHRM